MWAPPAPAASCLLAAAPAAAQEKVTTVWSATLTANSVTVGVFGCHDSSVPSRTCEPDGALTDDDFTFHGTPYAFLNITLNDGLLNLIFEDRATQVPDSFKSLVLHVGGEQFPFAAATIDGRRVKWNDRGLIWSADQQVALKLTTPPVPSRLTLSANKPLAEGGGDVTVTLTLNQPIHVATEARTGVSESETVEASEFGWSPGKPRFAKGGTTSTVTVTTYDDSHADPGETVTLYVFVVSPLLGGGTTLQGQITFTIIDNDDGGGTGDSGGGGGEGGGPGTGTGGGGPGGGGGEGGGTGGGGGATPSSDASLSGLLISVGSMAFDPARTNYAVAVTYAVESVRLTPTVNHAGATVAVNGAPVARGSLSGSIPLSVGENPVKVVVTAEDGTTRTYTVTVTRGQSSDASLSGLLISDGSLAFDPARTSYAVAVAHAVESVRLTPTVNHAGATVAVNGTVVASGTPSGAIPLSVGENPITVVVTAEDGTTRTYRVTVTRGTRVLGADEKALVDKVGMDLLGRDDPGVYPPEGASNR